MSPARRVAAARHRIPAPLAAIMAVALVAALAWTCALPPLQGPDEDSHVAYVQKIAAAHEIPWVPSGTPADPGRPYSSELAYALTFGGVSAVWGNRAARPARTQADVRIWKTEDGELGPGAAADGGFTTAMRNPPLYYLYAAVPYAAASSLSIFDRVFVMRLANLPALLAVVVFTWLLAGELFAGRRCLQALATLAVALQPQLLHMTAVVNPDVFLAAIWAAALYVMAIAVKRGATRGRLAWLAVLTVASFLTQPRGVAIVIPVAAAVALAFWRHRRPARRWVRGVALGGATLVVVAGVVVMLAYAMAGQPSAGRLGEFASYLWQFYLPRPGFMAPSISPTYGAGQAFVERFFGGFGMLDANFSAHANTALKVLAAALVVLAAIGALRRWRDARRHPGLVAVLVLAVAGYLLVLHVAAFRSLLHGPDPVLTGRYLLPLLPLYGAMVALAVSWLPRRVAFAAGAAAASGLVVLQFAALGVLFARFYA